MSSLPWTSLRRVAAALAILLLAAGLGEGAVRPFVPEAPTLSAASLKPGERGVLKTNEEIGRASCRERV